ncbi:acetate--CoA ligase family protein [Solimonas sp. K1W22B-7]|uniref:acetate--CoA ligase family protein n=1 Tax=Solimonas sp. K1W22B-7 TaxID=2303331 RepID=UPI0013C4173F|nr:acetate--CoA ligase family protein [Solimonas sp. K1W22B-7]
MSLRLADAPCAMPGYAYGLRHPGLLVSVSMPAGESLQALRSLPAWLVQILGLPVEQAGGLLEENLEAGDILLQGMLALQRAAGLPLQEPGRVVAARVGHWLAVLPLLQRGEAAAAAAFGWLLRACNATLAGEDLQPLQAELPGVLGALAALLSSGSNAAHFMRTAQALGIPCRQRAGGVIQFGEGARARWLVSSFTDQTSHIAARLARHKAQASAMLAEAGIPVPRQVTVATAEAAVQAAAALGYPVVIKPEDTEGGIAVAPGLGTPEEVRAAFETASRYSRSILLESHVEGRDYRLNVFQGELVWAIERQPASVTGDGRAPVRELLQRLNADPRRGAGKGARLRRVELDEEALSLLRKAGLGPDDVPAEGRVLRLRRVANIGAGAVPVPVFDQVHPDNARLAIRAAEALGLDLAGVDLLIPDIARSWHEGGAAVCEVNGQPTLGQITSAHLYPLILGRLVRGNGRIPTALVIGAGEGSGLLAGIAARLGAAGLRVGCVGRQGVTAAGERIAAGPVGSFAGGRMLVAHRGVDAALVAVDDAGLLDTGLPFARYDLLVLAGAEIAAAEGQAATPETLLREVLRLVHPACDGEVLALAGAAQGLPPPASASSPWLAEVPDESELAARAAAALLAADHRPSAR